jgi:hypothetical protein
LKKSKQGRKPTRPPTRPGAPRHFTKIEEQMVQQKTEVVRELERKLALEDEIKARIREADLEHKRQLEPRQVDKPPASPVAAGSTETHPLDISAGLHPSISRAVKLLIGELRKVDEKFDAALREHPFWSDSIAAPRDNSQYFELHRQIWLDEANAALDGRFQELVELLSHEDGTKEDAVRRTENQLRHVVLEHSRVVPILEAVSSTVPAVLPPGVGDQNDDIESLSDKIQQSLLLHLHEIAEETLVRFDLRSVSQPTAAQLPEPREHKLLQSAQRRRQTLPRRDIDRRRYAFMFLAIKEEKRGMEYCKFLDENKVWVGIPWLTDGCPKTYPLAYADPKWRRQIHQEKNRASRKMAELERDQPSEFKKIMGLTGHLVSAVSRKD